MNYSTGGVRAAPFAALKSAVRQERVIQKPRAKLALFGDVPLGAWFRLFTLVRHTRQHRPDYQLTERVQELPLNVKDFVHGAQVELEETHPGMIFVKTGHQHGIDLMVWCGGSLRAMPRRDAIIPGQRAVVLFVKGPTGVYTQDKQYISANYEVNV